MCGIAGAFGPFLKDTDPAMPATILRKLAHRGPDDQGVFLLTRDGPRVGTDLSLVPGTRAMLLHRRLAIIDCSEAGWQPMASADGRFFIVFNGEIYNYLELKSELQELGHSFRSQSDTEVLLAAYVEWGVNALNRLIGMFSFAIIDTKIDTLVLARDFFGIKPLYYYASDNGFCFSSEIKSILDWDFIDRNVNPTNLYLFLRYGLTDQGESTLFASINQLPAAHYMVIALDRPGEPEIHRYWDITVDRQTDIAFSEAAETLRSLFLDSVRLHIRSDVPIGAALSGGIDSSAIVMAMRHICGSQLDLHTFSYIAEGSPLNEDSWIDLVGKASGAIMHKTGPSSEDLVNDFQRIIYDQDEPIGSTSVFAQRTVFALAQQNGVKVMLDGQGADELLGGYHFFAAARLASLVRGGELGKAVHFVSSLANGSGAGSKSTISQSLSFLLPLQVQEPLRWLSGHRLFPIWLDSRWFTTRGVMPQVVTRHDGERLLQSHLYRSLTQTGVPHLLRYEDRNSMTFSVESRVPFLTAPIANFIFSLPEAFIVSDKGLSKAVFREAMRGIVPDPILDRRDKIGFATPEKEWLSQQSTWIRGLLSEAADLGIPINPMKLNSNARSSITSRSRTANYLWRCVNLVGWSKRFGVTYN